MAVFTNIEKLHTQTARPGTTTYKYSLRAGIKPATRSAAVDRSTIVLTVLFVLLINYYISINSHRYHRRVIQGRSNTCTGTKRKKKHNNTYTSVETLVLPTNNNTAAVYPTWA